MFGLDAIDVCITEKEHVRVLCILGSWHFRFVAMSCNEQGIDVRDVCNCVVISHCTFIARFSTPTTCSHTVYNIYEA